MTLLVKTSEAHRSVIVVRESTNISYLGALLKSLATICINSRVRTTTSGARYMLLDDLVVMSGDGSTKYVPANVATLKRELRKVGDAILLQGRTAWGVAKAIRTPSGRWRYYINGVALTPIALLGAGFAVLDYPDLWVIRKENNIVAGYASRRAAREAQRLYRSLGRRHLRIERPATTADFVRAANLWAAQRKIGLRLYVRDFPLELYDVISTIPRVEDYALEAVFIVRTTDNPFTFAGFEFPAHVDAPVYYIC